jgi:hypothetical protein
MIAGLGLQAAWRLARGKADGAAMLEQAPGSAGELAARSFWAVPLCLPAFICLHLLSPVEAADAAAPVRAFAMDLLGFVIGWVGFALISHRLTAVLGRGVLWPRFIAAWNWCNLLQYLFLLFAAIPSLVGMPDIVSETIWVVAMGWALWLEWFVTRLTLAVPGRTAAALVALDMSFGLLLMALAGLFR